MADRTDRETEERIAEMVKKGMQYRDIAEREGVCIMTISRIAKRYGVTKDSDRQLQSTDIKWLKEIWAWDIPKKKEPKKHSEFRTMYNCPKYWTVEREEQ